MPSAVTPYYTRQVFGLCLVSEDHFISRIGVHFEHKRRCRMLPCLVGNTNPSTCPAPPRKHRLMTYPKSRRGATLTYTFSKVNWDPMGMCVGISKSYQENRACGLSNIPDQWRAQLLHLGFIKGVHLTPQGVWLHQPVVFPVTDRITNCTSYFVLLSSPLLTWPTQIANFVHLFLVL